MHTRLLRAVLWLITVLLVLLAILVTALRMIMPQINQYQPEISHWVNQQTQANITFEHIDGYWRNAHPSLLLTGVKAYNLDGEKLNLSVQKVEVEFDFIQSLLRGQLVVADLTLDKLGLDASSIPLLHFGQDDQSESKDAEHNLTNDALVALLNRLFLRQLDRFSIIDSEVRYQSLTGELHTLAVEKLRWRNQGDQHLAEGQISIVGTGVNSLHIGADFVDFGSLTDLSGQFYLQANHVALGPWLSSYLKQDMGITDGEISFDGWIDIEHSQPYSSYVALRPSQFNWGNHQFAIEKGVIESSVRIENGQRTWVMKTHSFALRTDQQIWPGLDLMASWSVKGWKLALAEANLDTVMPFSDIVPNAEQFKTWLDGLNPLGIIRDLRISLNAQQGMSYSANLEQLSINQWNLLPELHHLKAKVTGNGDRTVIDAELMDDPLPYADIFQAPLEIEQGRAKLVIEKVDSAWVLWSNHVAVTTPHLSAIGEFRLDLPQDQPPKLGMYVEASVNDAGQTWRYLPTRALGQHLTDYLSGAIQGGEVDHAQLIWYGELKQFPYLEHDGIFQANVPITNAKFGFDSHWPTIDELSVNLLFQNESLNFKSYAAKLGKIQAQSIQGEIPRLVHQGHLDIKAQALADGLAIRDYMMLTPLANSVGAALNSVQVNGDVAADFQLYIPFDFSHQEVRAWGNAKFNNNLVNIQTPSLTINRLFGEVSFDNDRINAKNLYGYLLGQRTIFGFSGKSSNKAYQLNVFSKGTWQVGKLEPYVGAYWIDPLKGDAPWSMGINLQLHDVGFTYDVDLNGDLTRIASQYPYPLNKSIGDLGEFTIQATGNQRSISARAQLPNVKYQLEIDLTQPTPVLTDTYLLVGSGSFKPHPIVGHQLFIRSDKFSLDDWIPLMFSDNATAGAETKPGFSVVAKPQNLQVEVEALTAGGLEWHDAKVVAHRNHSSWQMDIASQEMQGKATYVEPLDLSVSLKQLHLYLPALESLLKDPDNNNELKVSSGITEFDRNLHNLMPNLSLLVDDFWLQGYKIGRLNMNLLRQEDSLVWKNIDITSGSSEVHANGRWFLKNQQSNTSLTMSMKGDNNSDVMERFGVTSGIQKAPFSISSKMQWNGAPWSAKLSTLNGNLKTKLGKGVVSDVSGAAKLLGLFSLDSIIRKMQLDFSDVFDSGMAFDSIEGSGEITNGIFVTNNITMDAMAGDMAIKGLVDLNKRLIDSEVSFVPDVTSGIPVLSAFAVTPVTALYVLAITTVISPVVEVFTEVNYSVKGSIDAPVVKEISRTKGEFSLPEDMRQQVERQGASQ